MSQLDKATDKITEGNPSARNSLNNNYAISQSSEGVKKLGSVAHKRNRAGLQVNNFLDS